MNAALSSLPICSEYAEVITTEGIKKKSVFLHKRENEKTKLNITILFTELSFRNKRKVYIDAEASKFERLSFVIVDDA